MSIIGNAVPAILYTHSPSFPVGNTDFIERYQHVSLGRVWVLSREPLLVDGILVDDTVIVLVDTENDGVFDDSIVGDASSLYQAGTIGADTVLINYDGD
jgi:hypothetical protein